MGEGLAVVSVPWDGTASVLQWVPSPAFPRGWGCWGTGQQGTRGKTWVPEFRELLFYLVFLKKLLFKASPSRQMSMKRC